MSDDLAAGHHLHLPHPHFIRDWLEHRRANEVAKPADSPPGFNDRIALKITSIVGTMWCAYAFALLALVSLPQAISGGIATQISWVAQTFLQLVLLSIIMVGQKVAAAASDKQAYQTYKDAEAILHLTDQMQQLVQINTKLTEEIHVVLKCNSQ